METNANPPPFNLLRWFAWLSPIVIAAIAVANAWLISTFLDNHLFQREALVSRDFVQNILRSDGSLDYLARPDDADLAARFRNSIDHLSNMRDVLRANVYGADRTMLWSTDAELIGRRLGDNEELDEAMRGDLVVHAGRISGPSRHKDEHVGLDPSVDYFVESYIPITRAEGEVIGVVELYKAPLALTEAIREGRMQVTIAALGSALALYLTLFWLIRRADGLIKRQHGQLLETETMAVVGELTSSVAHNIRNPLSSIRSSAEVLLEFAREDCREPATDIIREVDRISLRITELLRLSGRERRPPEAVDLAAVLHACAEDHRAAFVSRGQTLAVDPMPAAAMVMADRSLLQQVFHSLLGNAAEAMGAGGRCSIRLGEEGRRWFRVEIADSGSGIDPATARQVFRPFFTTKPTGLGLGLPLAQRIVARFGGRLSLDSQPGRGTTVAVVLPRH